MYTEVCVDTDRGTFVATAATPRALLASRVASCLSTDEMAILTALNAGIPRDLLQGQPRGYRMYQLVGISTPAAAAEKEREEEEEKEEQSWEQEQEEQTPKAQEVEEEGGREAVGGKRRRRPNQKFVHPESPMGGGRASGRGRPRGRGRGK